MTRWHLVDKVPGTRRTDLGGRLCRTEHVAGGVGVATGGVVVDGTVWPLDGEPPRAVSQGWGDLSWTRRR